MQRRENGPREAPPTFFTVSDSGFFLGTVALLNSLRLTGHTDELVVLDCGLTDRQRSLLRGHCTVVGYERPIVGTPAWLKPFPHLLGAEGTVVILDSDIIVTGPLSRVFAAANDGRICTIRDTNRARWFPEWQELFELSMAPRRQPYVASGFVAFSTSHWPELLPRWWERCQRHTTLAFVRGRRTDPLQFLDQDALNATLMTEVPGEALEILPTELSPFGSMLESVRIEDLDRLRCRCRKQRTLLLHNSGNGKPWDPQLRTALRKWRAPYVALLRRVLAASDVTVRVPTSDLPPWLRSGIAGAGLAGALGTAVTTRHRLLRGRRSAQRRAARSEVGVGATTGSTGERRP